VLGAARGRRYEPALAERDGAIRRALLSVTSVYKH
jgi:hypothetical protein